MVCGYFGLELDEEKIVLLGFELEGSVVFFL